MESKDDVHVFVIPMCLGLNYEFSVLLVPRELQKSYPGIEIDIKFINQLLIERLVSY
jgi:hypothetical protein